MSCCEVENIVIDAGTTHEIEIAVYDRVGQEFDLSGFDAVFTCIYNNDTIEKRCVVQGNMVAVVLDPQETMVDGMQSAVTRQYQIRVFKEDKVYEIIHGKLTLRKCLKQHITLPNI